MAIGTASAIGLGITAVSTGYSFATAAAQKKEQRKAEDEAKKYLSEARKKLDVNFYEQLGIQREPYDLAREAAISTAAQALEAGRESERGAAATAGRVFLGAQKAQRDIATAMGQEMAGLQKLSAAEEARLRDAQAELDIREATGAQKAAAVAEQRSAQALFQGMQGVASLGQQVAAAFPDYAKTESVRQTEKLQKSYEDAIAAGTLQSRFRDIQGNPLPFQQAIGMMQGAGFDVSKVPSMNPIQFKDYMAQQSSDVLRQLNKQAFSSETPYIKPFSVNPFEVAGFESLYGPQ